jgi:peptidoglycan/LPS O-acetylase OafA/YrhL
VAKPQEAQLMKKDELAPLTGVRFYAALFVFVSHLSDLPGLEWLRNDYLFFAEAGKMGVSVFFVLSGFILTYNYSDAFEFGVTLPKWARFVWNRLSKIYPTHLLTLLACIPLQILSPNRPLDWMAVPVHLFLQQSFLPFSDPAYYTYLNIPSWSISCEFFFYLLAPLAIWFISGRKSKMAILLMLVVYLGGCALFLSTLKAPPDREYFLYYFAPVRLIEFIGGIGLAVLYFRRTTPLSIGATNLLFICGITTLVIGGGLVPQLRWPVAGAINYLPGSLILIYALARSTGPVARHMGWRPMLVLGMASFAFYMIHMPIIRCVRGVFRHFDYTAPAPPVSVGAAIATFLLTQACALGMFYWFESPVQNRLRKFIRRERAASLPIAVGRTLN